MGSATWGELIQDCTSRGAGQVAPIYPVVVAWMP